MTDGAKRVAGLGRISKRERSANHADLAKRVGGSVVDDAVENHEVHRGEAGNRLQVCNCGFFTLGFCDHFHLAFAGAK